VETNRKQNERLAALVTGASSGIGYELAKIFASNGFDLIIVAEDSRINEAKKTFSTLGVNVEALQIDLAEPDGVERLYQRIREIGWTLDSAAINAGVGVSGEFAETDLGEELNLIHLNIISSVQLAKHLVRDMLAEGHGRILFTSSIAAEMPGPYYAVYAASKSFLQSFAEALHYELKDKGITVTALQPGPTDTNFFARADMLNTPAGQASKDDPAKVAQDGFDALMAGRDHVVAGSLKNNMQAGVARFASETQRAKMHAKQTKPLDKH
jgi:short-subunit dehydrogenase